MYVETFDMDSDSASDSDDSLVPRFVHTIKNPPTIGQKRALGSGQKKPCLGKAAAAAAPSKPKSKSAGVPKSGKPDLSLVRIHKKKKKKKKKKKSGPTAVAAAAAACAPIVAAAKYDDEESEDDGSSEDEDENDSMSGSDDVGTSSESDEGVSESDADDISKKPVRAAAAAVAPGGRGKGATVTEGVPVFYASSESRDALSRLKRLVSALSNHENKDRLPNGSFACISDANELTKDNDIIAMSIDSAKANELLASTAQIASHLAEGLQNACSRAPEDVVAFRKIVSSLSDVWHELLPALEAFKSETEIHADQAAKTARMAVEIYGKHIGMVSTITSAITDLRK